MKTNRPQNAKTLLGTLAAASAASSSQAALVQITLSGNQVSSNNGNNLVADITGDSLPDLVFANVQRRPGFYPAASVQINGGLVFASSSGSAAQGDAQFAVGGIGVASTQIQSSGINIKYLNPITFSDSRINGGSATQGYLEVNSRVVRGSTASVVLTRLVFNDASTTLPGSGLGTGTTYTEWTPVPEPSSLGLLALGAGGLLARRRVKREA
jgi:hypothetical protein